MKTLLIDDERLARNELRRLLVAFPHIEIVGEARTAQQARELIGSVRPDLVFLDVQMPGETGLELLESLEPPAPRVKRTPPPSSAARKRAPSVSASEAENPAAASAQPTAASSSPGSGERQASSIVNLTTASGRPRRAWPPAAVPSWLRGADIGGRSAEGSGKSAAAVRLRLRLQLAVHVHVPRGTAPASVPRSNLVRASGPAQAVQCGVPGRARRAP